MKTPVPCKLWMTLCVLVLLVAPCHAQKDAGYRLFDSPEKRKPAGGVFLADEVKCSVELGGGGVPASLFGVDLEEGIIGKGQNNFFVNELFSPFRVFFATDDCDMVNSFTTAFPGSTATGIASDHVNFTYWLVDLEAGVVREFQPLFGTATGDICPLPSGFSGNWGPMVIDNNQPGRIAYVQDIADDVIVEFDLATCTAGCTFANPDAGGGVGAFGNGLGDACDPDACGGSTLLVSSGTVDEGQVTRVSQTDCSGNTCRDTWDLVTPLVPSGEDFVNGIEEFDDLEGNCFLAVVGNATNQLFVLQRGDAGIGDCQDIDANMDVLFVNGSRGGPGLTVPVDPATSIATSLQRTPAGNGKFVFHLNEGTPDGASVTPLLDLGSSCFPFIGGSPSVVENNVGKTSAVGASNYFGTAISDPDRAPTFVCPTQAEIDTANLPSGSQWTAQSVHLNDAASSKRGASLSNALIVQMQ